MEPGALRADLLSTREREVLDLAVEGRTDEQIAQALDISPSTVNSYWVRIRGKVGPFSRTELVRALLRHESGLKHADLLADVERLNALHEKARQKLAQAHVDLRAMRGSSWHLLALDHVPEATFVCEPPGRIVYANLQAQHLFLAEPGELEGESLESMAAEEFRGFDRDPLPSLFRPEGPPRAVIGVEQPYYAAKRDGTVFRAVLVAEKFMTPEGLMSAVNVREAMQDIEAFIALLRRPFVTL